MKYVLLVTWIFLHEPPHSYQVIYNSAEACHAARANVLADAKRLIAERDSRRPRVSQQDFGNALVRPGLRNDPVVRNMINHNYRDQFQSSATVTAVCTAQ
jgi:hypothetical protein